MFKRKYLGASLAVLCVLAGKSMAVGPYTVGKQGASSVPGFYGQVEVDVAYDDNILRVDDIPANKPFKIDSVIGLLKPQAAWVGVLRKHRVTAGYNGEYALYEARSKENYKDHWLGADIAMDLTPRFNLFGDVNYQRQHESRGSTASNNQSPNPNIWDQRAVGLEGVYGRRSAQMQIGLRTEYSDRDYTNNNQSDRDTGIWRNTMTAYYNIGPKTQLVVEPSYETTKYQNQPAAPGGLYQDSDKFKILGGVRWEATAKTTGEVKVGWSDKDYEDNRLADNSGLAIDANVTWQPKTYSTVGLNVSRDIEDASNGTSNSYEHLSIGLNWRHALSNRMLMKTGVNLSKDDYDSGLTDKYYDFSIGIDYDLSRALTLGASYSYENQNSDTPNSDYSANVLNLGLTATFQ